jgi:hypothetical protein
MCYHAYRPFGLPIYVARVPAAPLYLGSSRCARPLPSRRSRPCRSSRSLHSRSCPPRFTFYVACPARSILTSNFRKGRDEGCFASARRSAFFRRLARFLKLSLPLLCPINVNFRPVVVPYQRDETEAGVCAVAAAAALDSAAAGPHPELS